jgi:putative transposase
LPSRTPMRRHRPLKGCGSRIGDTAWATAILDRFPSLTCLAQWLGALSWPISTPDDQLTMNPLYFVVVALIARLRCPIALSLENVALRQQLAVCLRERPRRRLKLRDRVFWLVLRRFWRDWRSALVIVQSDTVVRWHRQGFRLYWRWKSRSAPVGRPKTAVDIRELILRMANENPTWGAPRIQAELRLLGYAVADSTVARYMGRISRKPPSPTWKTFLKNHLSETAAVDFFVVPTATFRLLYVFVVLSLDRRRVLHFNVTAHPSASWTAQQVAEAFPYDEVPRYLMRDRDGIYGEVFQRRVKYFGIEEIASAPRSPWQNPYVERVIGSIRRDCLDHMIVLNETHLKRTLASYLDYYHESRTHLSLERNAPTPREMEPPERGPVRAIPHVGGLHHRYTRAA